MICAVLTPLLGYVIDLYGRRTLWILTGPVLLFATHLLLLLDRTPAVIPLAGLGLAYRCAYIYTIYIYSISESSEADFGGRICWVCS